MILLSVENLSKSYGIKQLFSNITFGIEQGQKAALVARNGTGKSTLLRILQGKDIPDSGRVTFRNDTRVSFLEQDPVFSPEATVYETIFNSPNEVLKAIRNYELVVEAIEEDPSEKNQNLMQDAMMEMDNLKAWDYEVKVKQILSKLLIRHLDQTMGTLSGGQQKRVALARVLIEEPQLLIMDEPTNHLDLDMIEWLESYFVRHDVTLLLVTHDRYFLDNVCTDILEMENNTIYRYKGNYEYFVEKKAEREFNEASEMDKARNLFRRELEWVRRQPKARGTKSKSRVDAFNDLEEKVAGKRKQEDLQLNVKMNRIGGKILELKKVSKSYGDLQVMKGFDYTFKKGERIGIVGKNGVGKTTFLNILTEREQPDSGKVNVGETIIFGYYSQLGMQLKEDKRIIEVVRDVAEVIPLADGSKVTASQFLQLFQFSPEMQYSYVSKLSGGEKKRLFLLTVLIKNPNFLILDEPTNDLDLITLQVLEDFLQNYQGCLIMVSHDRYFMDKLVDTLLVFEGEGVISGFVGNYGEYRQQKADEEKELKENARQKTIAANTAAAAAVVAQPAAPKQKLSYNEKTELDKLEKSIPETERKKVTIEQEMNSGITDHGELMRLAQELAEINASIEGMTLRWMELSEKA